VCCFTAQVAAAVGASAVFCNRRYEPAMAAADAAVEESLAAAGLQLQSYSGLLLQEPWEVQVSGQMWFETYRF
jgi:deoxyribodipyrimidine photo-lyase